MGTRPRVKPEHLPAKLLAIRKQLGLSQSKIAKRLGFNESYGRISEYETGAREPNLMVLLRYSEIAEIHLASIINDRVDLEQFYFELEQ